MARRLPTEEWLLPDFVNLAAPRNVHVVHIFELLVRGAVLRRVRHHLLEVLFISGEAVMGAGNDDAVLLPVMSVITYVLFLGVRPFLEELGKLRGISRFADEYVVDDDHKKIDPTYLRQLLKHSFCHSNGLASPSQIEAPDRS